MPSPDEGVAPVSTNFGIDSSDLPWFHSHSCEKYAGKSARQAWNLHCGGLQNG